MANQANNFENVLNKIQSQYISLPDHEVRRNKEILNRVVNDIIKEMKNDALFSKYYNRIFYGGSFFDGLRVEKPEEFDLDFLLKVPKLGKPILSHTNEPGFLELKFTAPDELSEDFKKKMLDDKYYLSSAKVLQWMESCFTKAMNKFRTSNGSLEFVGDTYRLTGRLSKSEPAMTLILSGSGIKIDVDLVPCFEFQGDKWPTGGYRKNPVPSKSTFFIVPKSPKNIPHHSDRYLRLSFQEQERELLNGKRSLKPTLKLLKRLRDVLQHKAIASYYIKTIFLWEDEKHGASYWDGTMTDTFFKMLDTYIEYIESGKIPYFWNKKNNLINIPPETQSNIKNRLKAIQKDILAKYKTEPLIICKYLGTPIVINQSAIETTQLLETFPQYSADDNDYDNDDSLMVNDHSYASDDSINTDSGSSAWVIGITCAVGLLAAGYTAYSAYSNSRRRNEENEKENRQ